MDALNALGQEAQVCEQVHLLANPNVSCNGPLATKCVAQRVPKKQPVERKGHGQRMVKFKKKTRLLLPDETHEVKHFSTFGADEKQLFFIVATFGVLSAWS